MSTAAESPTSEPSFYERKGIASWLLTTDHKRIGILYLGSMMTFFLVGMTFGVFMRLEQLTMGPTIMKPTTYNALFTLHGVMMISCSSFPACLRCSGISFCPS